MCDDKIDFHIRYDKNDMNNKYESTDLVEHWPHSTFENARAFHESSKILMAQDHVEPNERVILLWAPAVVSAAFACELYMKSILLYRKKVSTSKELKKIGHELIKLFDSLDTDIKDSIAFRYFDKDTFYSTLTDQSQAFDAIRYYSEKHNFGIDPKFLPQFADVLLGIARLVIYDGRLY